MARMSTKTESWGRFKGGGSATKTVSLTHEQIAERAKSIWLKKGCPPGQDEKIWYEAEAQLKRELGIE